MIFTIINNIPRITPEGLFIPEMRKIWESDKSTDKNDATQELIYIYHMAEPKSVYNKLSEDIKEYTIIQDYIRDKSWKPNEDVQAAIAKYKMLTETAVYRSFKTVEIAMDKLNASIRDVDKVSLDKGGNFAQVQGFIEKMEKVAMSYAKLKEVVDKELEQPRKIKGGVKPSIILSD